ncbi:hypothetical protein OLMES_1265 [Oleiphilus messinensis]|uniref:Response regulatory domain-containing protein n=1 Tax=Oleiphilus messinensis TaxID=141451 RepID=A0A1Y0I4D2_9GAMM|nr:response regulator [Oleiphilus messinensis]ARU55347.1 hypothetical protein OLMES_1265 [Oleiphilus messinensis]
MAIKKALVVDDSPTARHVLGRMLKQLGFAVLQAESGPVALTLLRKESPHLVFLDHIMPEMDGFQVLKSLKSSVLTESIPVVMYTSQAATKYQLEAKALGAVAVISKQIDVVSLANLIDTVLEPQGSAEIIPLKRKPAEKSTCYGEPAQLTGSLPYMPKEATALVRRQRRPVSVMRIGLLTTLIGAPFLLFSYQLTDQQYALNQVVSQVTAVQARNHQQWEVMLERLQEEQLKLQEERKLVNNMVMTLAAVMVLPVAEQDATLPPDSLSLSAPRQ